jgi:hypothetical protein
MDLVPFLSAGYQHVGKLLIEKDVITEVEFPAKIAEERSSRFV